MNDVFLELKFSSLSSVFLNEYYKKYYVRYGSPYFKQTLDPSITLESLIETLQKEYPTFFKHLISKNFQNASHGRIGDLFIHLEESFRLDAKDLHNTVYDKEMLNTFLDIFYHHDPEELQPFHVSTKIMKNIVMYYVFLNDPEKIINDLTEYVDQYDFVNIYHQMAKNSTNQYFLHCALSILNSYRGKSRKQDFVSGSLAFMSDAVKQKVIAFVDSKEFSTVVKKFIESYASNYSTEVYLLGHVYKNEVSRYSCGITIPAKYNLVKNLVKKAENSKIYLNKEMIDKNIEKVHSGTGFELFHEIKRELSDIKRLYNKGMLTKEAFEYKKKKINDVCQDITERLSNLKKDLDT